MNNITTLLLLLAFGTFSQVILNFNTTLIGLLEQSKASDPIQASALLLLFQSHPEMQNYTILSINMNKIMNSSVTDFEIALSNSNIELIAIVSVSQFLPSFLVSLQPKSDTIQSSASTLYPSVQISNSSNNRYHFASINVPQFSIFLIPAPILSDYLNKSKNLIQNNLLGGFKVLLNLQDSRFKLAASFAKSKRHNLINYNISHVEYQVVSGINYFIEFIGFDKLTKILVVVAIDIKMRPSLIFFSANCINQTADCTKQTASLIYGAIELLLMTHNELLEYSVESILIEYSNGVDSLQLLVTLQNTSLKIRALADLKIQNKQLSIMSYYTYPSEQ